MRIRRYRTGDDQFRVDLTPMLDVVFIMLVFFVVTTSLSQTSVMDLSLPSAGSGEDREGETLVVQLSAEGDVAVKGRQLPLSRLAREVSNVKERSARSAVVIEADQKTSTALLVAVMDEVRAGGIDRIALATEKRR